MTSKTHFASKAWHVVTALALTASMAVGGTVTAQAAPGCVVTADAADNKAYGSPANMWGSTSGCEGGTLVAEVRTDNGWQTISTTTAQASGSFVLPLQGLIEEPGSYQIRATLGDTSSAATPFVRLARPTAQSAGTKYVGQATYTWGTAPGQANRPVWTEVRLASGWSVSRKGSTDADGRFVLPLTYGTDTAGPTEYRVAVLDASGTVVRTEGFSLVRLARPTAAAAATKSVGQGAYVWGTATGLPGRTVWTEVLIGSRWSRSQQGTTDASGKYVLPLTYGINTAGVWKYRVGVRDQSGQTVYSNTVTVERISLPTISTAGTAPLGRTTNAWGTFAKGANIPVWVEVRLPDGTWSRSQTGNTNASGYYALPLTYGSNTAGTYQFRVAGRYPNGEVVRSAAKSLVRVNPSYDLDKRCLTGRALCASKTTRKLHWVVDGKVLAVMDARFGKPSSPTREGQFSVGWKSRYHVSSLYGSSMPWAMFFSGGQAVHYSADFAAYGYSRPGSHGCINIRDAKTLDWVYSQVRVGDKVVVHW